MKKQIILLMTDTTRKDMLGCYGDERMKTPNLDRLAAQGLRYEKCVHVSTSMRSGKKCNFYRSIPSFKWYGD